MLFSYYLPARFRQLERKINRPEHYLNSAFRSTSLFAGPAIFHAFCIILLALGVYFILLLRIECRGELF